jgi:hypothetical protein
MTRVRVIAARDPNNHSNLPPDKDPTVVLFQVS